MKKNNLNVAISFLRITSCEVAVIQKGQFWTEMGYMINSAYIALKDTSPYA
jgi:hypothetical protein